jgi:hypothetical protein
MCDFSSSNSLPQPTPAEGWDDLLAALDVLVFLVEEVYLPFVLAVVTAARKFLLRQKTLRAVDDLEALADLVFWIDERLEKIRTFVVLGSTKKCDSVQSEFNVAHESYVQVQNIIYERQHARLEQARQGSQYNPTSKSDQRSRHRDGAAVKQVPDQVLDALPSQKGKKLCMKFLANDNCRSRGSRCFYNYRGHFRPRHLPVVVKEFIEANYGGFKPEFQDL